MSGFEAAVSSDAAAAGSVAALPSVSINTSMAAPIHFIIGRSSGNSGEAAFVSDIRNATLSRDLSKYKGFVPANTLLGEGLAAPNFGGTIKAGSMIAYMQRYDVTNQLVEFVLYDAR